MYPPNGYNRRYYWIIIIYGSTTIFIKSYNNNEHICTNTAHFNTIGSLLQASYPITTHFGTFPIDFCTFPYLVGFTDVVLYPIITMYLQPNAMIRILQIFRRRKIFTIHFLSSIVTFAPRVQRPVMVFTR